MRITVICPHFAPDTAPTGQVITEIVRELQNLGHHIHVVTSLPWYRNHSVEDGWRGRLFATEKPAGDGSPEYTHSYRISAPTS